MKQIFQINYGGKAICTANQNRLNSKSVSATPCELLTNKKHNLKYLKAFSCTTYMYIYKIKHGKLDKEMKKAFLSVTTVTAKRIEFIQMTEE